jgi:hypothetical protein
VRATVVGLASIVRGVAVVAALGLVAPPTLAAQSRLSHATAGSRTSPADSSVPPESRQRPRLYSAATFGLAGAVALGAVGYFLGSQCKRACNVLSKDRVILGLGAGAIVGSTYGAARAQGRGHCTHTERIGMGLGGAVVGALASTGTAQFPPGRISMLAIIPLGSVMFMGGC